MRHPLPGWVAQVGDPQVRALFGELTFTRGRDYQRQGRVGQVEAGADGSVSATVRGSQGSTYRAAAWMDQPRPGQLPGRTTLRTSCSCPVGMVCKHVVAVLLAARAQAHGQGASARTPAWESALQPVVRATRGAVERGRAPLGLSFQLREGHRHGTRTLQLRPVQPGRTGSWVRTGVGWGDLQHGYRRGDLPAHRDVLVEIGMTARVRSASWYAVPDWLDAAEVGPGLWALLTRAVEAGVALVTGPKGGQAVQLLSEPAQAVLDATGTKEGGLVLRPVLLGLPDDLDEAVPVGRPVHGLAAPTATGLTVGPLSQVLPEPVTALLDSGALDVPAADVERFLSGYYPLLRQQVPVLSSDGSVALPEVAAPTLGLEVHAHPGHVTDLRWTFRYAVGDRAYAIPLLPRAAELPQVEVDVDGEGDDRGPVPVLRDGDAEEQLLASLDVLDRVEGLRTELPGQRRRGVVLEPRLTGRQTITLVREVLPVLLARQDVHVTVVGELLDYAEVDDVPEVSIATRDLPAGAHQQDWFDLEIAVRVGEHAVPLPELLRALARREEIFLLEDGSWFSLDVPALHRLRELVEEARALQDDPGGEGLRINRYQAGLWQELEELGVVAEQSQRWQRGVSALLALEEVPHPAPPEGLRATLRDYQLDGYRWLSFLWDHQLGGILADDMGLGKTLQTLAMLERARALGSLTPERPTLVVAPTSVLATWQREAATFAPELQVAVVGQTTRRSGRTLAETTQGAHLVVTSYALLRIDAQEFSGRPWSGVVLDEAQAVKNHQSRGYQVARSLSADVKIVVTGTPLENSLMDLWALLSIAAPGMFPHPARFTETYRRPIEQGDRDLLHRLRRRIRPLMLRRTKDAVAQDLPPKTEQVVHVPLNPAHRKVYDTHLQRERQRILGLLDDVTRHRVAILSSLTRLRQLSLDAHLVVPDAPASARPSKVDALVEQIVELAAEGHRCLVFSQFTRFLRVVRDRLDEAGVEHVYLDGRTRDRARRIAEFTDGDAPAFVISLKAGGSGLTLTQADYVFILDPWWNPAVEAQAVDRTHRIGQDKPVFVYRMIAEDTIEEKVLALQERKRELFSRVVDDGGLMGAPLTADDIRGLLAD